MLYNSDVKKLNEDFKELPKMVTKSQLTDWIIQKQINNRYYCRQASVLELINAAEKCGIEVKS